ncbi:FIST signal transduction protein [Clostridium estertheticum]|uniref:FIST signal transduction protein n=1 Tax=Clostridium estertheticum TaxID=238834 RepID=UPI001C0BB809|nr:FIST N-terminal domain-containing protein [Clostridium estertheticum]MBU3187189.1 FIST C-terminal domain-containing protein [Clostridium estertheticum]MCB2340247.1 FIST C-terminal domain-containing protein [Clostridium estertheticum]
MKLEQIKWKTPDDFQIYKKNDDFKVAHLVMIFGSRELISNDNFIDSIKQRYPLAYLIGCSTSGEIYDTEVVDDTLISTAISFESTSIECATEMLNNVEDSYEVGCRLAKKLKKEKLTHVFVISEGLNINGSEFIRGMKAMLPSDISITGGLAGDGILFEKTKVIANCYAKENMISVIGFYGDNIRIGYGSMGGWDSFGPERLITKSKNNILYEMDGKSALELYKTYLGDYAKDLPASALLFPLSIRSKDSNEGVVRSTFGAKYEDNGLMFVGDVPQGYYAKLMKANFDRLVNGAMEAAELSRHSMEDSPQLAILISCVGRKMVLKQRIEEEIEVVREILGEDCMFTGFYSYGEISPYTQIFRKDGENVYKLGKGCEFHNQTMTITTITEV